MSLGFFEGLLNQVDTITQRFVFDGYHSLVSTYSNTVYGLAVLSIMVLGYLAALGKVDLSLKEVGSRAFLMGFVLTFALHWDIFSSYVYDGLTKAPSEIAVHIVETIPTPQGPSNVNSGLQQVFNDGIDYAHAVWEQGSFKNLAPYVWEVCMMFITCIIAVIALAELIIAKFGLAIYLVLAPLVIPTLLFESTKNAIFDGWVRHLITFAFIPLFITCAMALCIALMVPAGQQMQSAIATQVTLTNVVPYLVCSAICVILLLKATQMAQSIAGGFAASLVSPMAQTGRYLSRQLKRAAPGLGRTASNMASRAYQYASNAARRKPAEKPNIWNQM